MSALSDGAVPRGRAASEAAEADSHEGAASRLSLSFRLPKEVPSSIGIQQVRVQPDGIRADVSGLDIPFNRR